MLTPAEAERKISNLSLEIARKMLKATDSERILMGAAITLLGQSQLMIESNAQMSRLLYTRAKQLAEFREAGRF